MKNKIKLFIDMDCVIADFCKSPMFKKGDRIKNSPPQMFEQFFFETLPPVDGALSAVRELLQTEKYDIHILTQPVKETHYSYSEKAAWVAKWFPELSGKLTLTQNKELLAGPDRILIDDSVEKWKSKWESNGGTFIHFAYNEFGDNRQEWQNITSTIEQQPQAKREV
jgi:5'(3')-deoxyribonucleotidase